MREEADFVAECKKSLTRIVQWRGVQEERLREVEDQYLSSRNQKKSKREKETNQRNRRRLEIYAWNTILEKVENANALAYLV